MKSIYIYKSNEEQNIQISFELNDKEKGRNLRDARAFDFLTNLLKLDDIETDKKFYLDDVLEMENK